MVSFNGALVTHAVRNESDNAPVSANMPQVFDVAFAKAQIFKCQITVDKILIGDIQCGGN